MTQNTDTCLTYQLNAPLTPRMGHFLRVFCRVLTEKANIRLQQGDDHAALVLTVQEGGAANSYTIKHSQGTLCITAPDELGLLYGIGKFLHTSTYRKGGFIPSTWVGVSTPSGSVRGIYFAHNFQNWNYSCCVDDFKLYLEDLMLWGLNTIAFNFVLYDNMQEPKRSAYLKRNREIIAYANALGLKVVLLYAPNTGLGPIPEAIRAHPFPDTTPARRGAGDNPVKFVCPSKPEGHAFIMQHLAADFACYEGLTIDAIVTFPYDAGGCGCEDCWPWGARGFPALSRDVITLARTYFMDCKLILCTWCYDVREDSDGEYEGLSRLLAKDNDWCDIIMADAHGDFPRYPIEQGVPGGLPMINFAEISMWGRYPWGGSGANPFPRRLEQLWQQTHGMLHGGLPYSEGRFEDINKVTCISLFWDREATADAIVREYANFEYGTDSVEQIARVITLLEEIYPTADLDSSKAEEALALLQKVETNMPETCRTQWRWRILLLRAQIDVERAHSPEMITVAQNDAYEELTRLYLAHDAGGPVAPCAKSFFARKNIEIKGPIFAEHIGEHASDPSLISKRAGKRI